MKLLSLCLLFGAVFGQESHLRQLGGSDPRTVIAKQVDGYVCSKGGNIWKNNELLRHLDSFLVAFEERHKVFKTMDKSNHNVGGNGLFHSFILWATLKNLRPAMVVESGVYIGLNSWLIQKATEEWNPTIVLLDPHRLGWEPLGAETRKMYDLRGADKFVDFEDVNWNAIEKNRTNAFVFFDDHMDQLHRLRQAHTLGFRHVMFDDNWIAGVGSMFTIKNACDRGGKVRAAFENINKPDQRCNSFHRQCHTMGPSEGIEAYEELVSLADVIWEGPPLTKLLAPYEETQKFIIQKFYEGPAEWQPAVHERLVVESTKAPIIQPADAALKRLHITKEDLITETGRYFNIVYIRVNLLSTVEEAETK